MATPRPKKPTAKPSLRIDETSEGLRIRSFPSSLPMGLAVLAFFVAFAFLGLRSVLPVFRVSVLGALLQLLIGLVLAGGLAGLMVVGGLSYQQIDLSRAGLIFSRRIFGVPIWRHRVALGAVGKARYLFDDAVGEYGASYLEISSDRPRPFYFSADGTEEIEAAAKRFNASLHTLRATAKATASRGN